MSNRDGAFAAGYISYAAAVRITAAAAAFNEGTGMVLLLGKELLLLPLQLERNCCCCRS